METHLAAPSIADRPLQFTLSFRPFIEYLEEQRRNASASTMDQLYAHLIDQFIPALSLTNLPPELRSSARLTEWFQLATVALLPLTGTTQDVPYAFGLPVPLRIYHCSPAFKQLTNQYPNLLSELPGQFDLLEQERYLYRLILEKCYGLRTTPGAGPSFRFQRSRKGLTRYFRMDVNVSFVAPHFEGELPPLQPAWVDFANGAASLPDGTEPLPLAEFSFEGFSFFRVNDLTETETIQQLQDVFTHLQSDTEPVIYRRFEAALRNLCGQPDLEISIVPLPQVNGHYVYQPGIQDRSVLLCHADVNTDGWQNVDSQQAIEHVLRNPEPQVYADLTTTATGPKQQTLLRRGIRSFLLYPITAVGEVLGVLEMGSPQTSAFTPAMLARLKQVLPLVQELLRYQLHQFNESIEQLVRKQFTSLQPAVEWKFYEAAWKQLRHGQSEPTGNEPNPVRFPQVYPFYGAVDIRNSSAERQKATRQDLITQLAYIEELLYQNPSGKQKATINELLTETYHWQNKLAQELTPDDESNIRLFLTEAVHPFLQAYPEQMTGVEAYRTRLDPVTGQFIAARQAYEQSMDRLNAVVNDFINAEEQQLQAIFPHYFERYRTDGTEYTIYVGQSIAPEVPFGRDVRRRLGQWQLTAMVEIARLTHRLRPELPVPLQTTQLILAHAHPVDISFRPDERRFDVEGSYSIRYEVMKKRIDKACIRGTQERLTQPGTIALVYTNSHELTDYLPWIAALQQSGSLRPVEEYVDLEPLQGIANLKALRLTINYEG